MKTYNVSPEFPSGQFITNHTIIHAYMTIRNRILMQAKLSAYE